MEDFGYRSFSLTSSKSNFYSSHSRKLLLSYFLEFHQLNLHLTFWADVKFFMRSYRHWRFCNKKPCTSCFWSLKLKIVRVQIVFLETFKSESNKHLKSHKVTQVDKSTLVRVRGRHLGVPKCYTKMASAYQTIQNSQFLNYHYVSKIGV